MSKDFRLQNMEKFKAALDAETAANRGTFIKEGIAGLEQKANYLRSTPSRQFAYDELERQTLASAGIPINEGLNFTFSKDQWNNAKKGGKRRTKRRHNNKKRRHSKRKHYSKRRR